MTDGYTASVHWTAPERLGGLDILDYRVEWDTLPLSSDVQAINVVAPVTQEVQVRRRGPGWRCTGGHFFVHTSVHWAAMHWQA